MIEEKVIALVSEMTGIDKADIAMEHSLDQLHLDEFGLVDIMMELESEFDVIVDDDIRILTVNDIVQCFCSAWALSTPKNEAIRTQIA